MRIGYYAHHHGSGHCRQADKFAAKLSPDDQHGFTVFTSVSRDDYEFTHVKEDAVIRLAPEDEREDEVLKGRAGQYWQPDCLHYSPVGNRDIEHRSWQILSAVHERQIDIMIIDVSAEVAMLCRAASVPYLYVRLAGYRDDPAHISAFAGALALLTPYPSALEAANTPEWVTQKSLYLGFITPSESSFMDHKAFIDSLTPLANKNAQRALQSMRSRDPNTRPHLDTARPLLISVIKGYGGHKNIDDKLPALRRACPAAFIISLGPIDADKRKFVNIATEVSDVTPFIAHSDLLIMACGLNSIAHVYDQDTPLVVLPDDRPHQEQTVMAEALIRQRRALGWTQFISLTEMIDNGCDSYGYDNKDQMIYQRLTDALSPIKAKASDNTLSAASNLINSLARYDAVKSWFHDWLLPKLTITPERMT